ncbi:MAG: hypothetical protein PVF58_17160 [Candidatus Methanofastidiosia archaeon]|jgi:hypothetical protein
MKPIYINAAGVWVLMVGVAIVNGILRGVYTPKVGSELLGHQISTLTLISAFVIIIYLFLRMTSAFYTEKDLVFIGVIWLVLTIVFEFGFGHYIMGNPWSKLIADYNILKGHVWGLVLLTILIAPYILGKYILHKV